MPEHSSQSIDIAAPPEKILAVVADFATYPQWSKSFKLAEVRSRYPDGRAETVHFVVDAGAVKDDYVLRYTWAADDTSVSWELVEGKLQRSQHGSYTLRQNGSGTHVTYSLTIDINLPMIGLLRRKAERVIMHTALNELKNRIET